MKKLLVLLFISCFSIGITAQSISGAWDTIETGTDGEKLRTVVLFADGYHVMTTYNDITGEFINTNGGAYKLEGTSMTKMVEFDTENPENIGTSMSHKVNITDDTIEVIDSNMTLNRIDTGAPGKLQGAWIMSGRVRDGETQLRDTSGPRKTMKILSGTRFQWIAYNIETKEFKGSGGGTYTTVDGEYTENIEFFSRDASKAGVSLSFDYELIDGDWHHSGLSSKGDPIHEIWSIRGQ